MRALIFILILLSFTQATFLPLNLVFLILILRAYIKFDKSNYYLAFGFGLLVSFLLQNSLGIHSLVYLVAVFISYLTTRAPFSKHILTVVPLSFGLMVFNYLSTSVLTNNFYLPWIQILIETTISLPIYIALRIWEERFVVRSDIKLKL